MSTEKICEGCGDKRMIPENRSKCNSCRSLEARLTNGSVRPPDYTDITVARYKEPMEKVKDGYGYYGAITETKDGKQIQCHVCGYFFSNVGAHVRNKHKQSPRDYKIKYGLRVMDGLLSPVAKAEAQVRYNTYTRKSSEEMKAMSIKGREAIKKKGVKIGGQGWNAQTRNERGMCKEQTAAKIRNVARMTGGLPTQKAFLQEYGTGQRDVVNYWFGSWAKALEELELKNYQEVLDTKRQQRMKACIKGIKRFYRENGRTPLYSDFNSSDYLPNYKTVQHYFGSLNNARVEACVPTLVFINREWVELEP